MPPPLWFSWTKFLLVILLLWIWGLVAWKNWLEGRSQKLYKWHTSTILSISGGKNVFDKVLNDLGLSFFFFFLSAVFTATCMWMRGSYVGFSKIARKHCGFSKSARKETSKTCHFLHIFLKYQKCQKYHTKKTCHFWHFFL